MEQKSALKSKARLVAKVGLHAKKSPTKPTKPKQKTITWYKHEADKCWSLATRLRFADLRDGEYWAECITCNASLPVKSLQCGHFMSRSYNSTRFVEENTAPQCYGCNVMHQGRQYEFGIALDELYGAGTAKSMHKLAITPKQWKRDELQEIIEEAKKEIAYYEK